jgi:2-polyprenyl-6-methoxyphenol hydroxylase-like FAD-dependent oxidoreductase
MGTTLALAGAYHLAGSLITNPDRHDLAFEEYEANMRPLVGKAQKLAPGMPHLLHPQSIWGVWLLKIFCAAIHLSGMINLLSRFKGPPAQVQEFRAYDFKIKKDH